MRGPESLLDHLLPRFDVRQVHEAWVPAPADVVYSAVKQVTGREVRVLKPLEFLRWLPGFLTGRRPSVRIQSAPLLAGFTAGVVSRGEHWGKEVVAGAVGASGAQDSNDPLAVKSPATGLCGLGDDAAVLVDRDHESCFRTPASEPAEREIEPMASHYHRLHATSRLDVEASCRPLSEVGVEGL